MAGLISFCLFYSLVCEAQVVSCRSDVAIQNITNTSVGSLLRAAPGAQVTVCTAFSGGSTGLLPCSPIAITDKNGTTLANPLTADVNGNFQFCTLNPGRFLIQIGGSGLTTFAQDNIILTNDPVNPVFTTSFLGIASAKSLIVTNGGNLSAVTAGVGISMTSGSSLINFLLVSGGQLTLDVGVDNGNHTLHLPIITGTDTIVTKTSTDNLTNKTFDATSNLGSVRIADTTLGAPTTNITFSGISGTFKSLMIVFQGRSDRAAVSDVAVLQFNGDTGANYDAQNVQGSNVTASANSSTGGTVAGFGQIPGTGVTRANIAASITITIPNYANTSFEKSFCGLGGFADSTAANNIVELRCSSWRNTAAITSIKLFPNVGTNFTTGTRATLYGLN